MIWGWPILEFIGVAVLSVMSVLGIGMGAGWIIGKMTGNATIPTGHSRYCTCPKCLIDRAEKDKQGGRERFIDFGDNLFLVNVVYSTRELRDQIGITVLLRPKGEMRLQFYRVVWVIPTNDEGMEVALRHLDTDQMVRIKFPPEVLDQRIWRPMM